MIRTKNNVNINTGFLETISEKLYGKIKEASWNRDFTHLLISGYYFYLSNGNEVIVKPFSKSLEQVEIDATEATITATGSGKCAKEKNLFEKAFIILMAAEYSLSVNDLEIV